MPQTVRTINTFSIVARDPGNGDLGLAVASKFLAAGAVVPWLAAEVGVMAVQALPAEACGPRGLEMLRQGRTAPETLEALMAADPGRDLRQVAIVDAQGAVAVHSGPSCMDWAGHQAGDGYSCQGNILTGEEVVAAMAAAFEGADGELSSRLVAALLAGDRAGGDRRGRQSAALRVVRKGGGYMGSSDNLVDLRVDDAPDPCGELARLHELQRFYFGDSPPGERMAITGELARELRDILARAGTRPRCRGRRVRARAQGRPGGADQYREPRGAHRPGAHDDRPAGTAVPARPLRLRRRPRHRRRLRPMGLPICSGLGSRRCASRSA